MTKDLTQRIRNLEITVLSDDWYSLKKATFEFLRSDGTWQKQSREIYNRGDGVTILLYSLVHRTVVLTQQFRYPTMESGYNELLIEAPAGLLDEAPPEARIIQETEEETGYLIQQPQKIFQCFMSPGAVTEIIHFFIAEYDPKNRASTGGGLAEEGEDIFSFEVNIEEALRMIASGKIRDAKTVMLLQYAALHVFNK